MFNWIVELVCHNPQMARFFYLILTIQTGSNNPVEVYTFVQTVLIKASRFILDFKYFLFFISMCIQMKNARPFWNPFKNT